MSEDEKHPGWYSESFARGLQVICAFGASTPSLRPADVSKLSGLSRASARRYLLTLQALGYLGTSDERFFLLPKILNLGYAFVNSMQIDKLIQPFLNELSVRTSEASTFAMLEQHEALFVARAAGPKILQSAVGVGGRVPAYSTSLGHVLLSGLSNPDLDKYLKAVQANKEFVVAGNINQLKASIEKTRKQGWVLVTDLLAEGIAAIAAPVKRRDGAIVGAVNVAKYGAINGRVVKQHLPVLLDTVQRIERALASSEQSALLGPAAPAQHPAKKQSQARRTLSEKRDRLSKSG